MTWGQIKSSPLLLNGFYGVCVFIYLFSCQQFSFSFHEKKKKNWNGSYFCSLLCGLDLKPTPIALFDWSLKVEGQAKPKSFIDRRTVAETLQYMTPTGVQAHKLECCEFKNTHSRKTRN